MFGKAKSLLFNAYSFKIDRELRHIKKSNDYSCKAELLKSVYSDMKLLSTNVLGCNEYKAYDNLRVKVLICEGQHCSSEYIIDSKPVFDPCDSRYINRAFSKYDTVEEFVEHLVWMTRLGLLNLLNESDPSITSLDDESLVNECYNTCCLVNNLCKMMNVPCKVIKIPPAFTDSVQLLDGHGFHYFNVISIKGRDFIVDCTYRQFFRVDKNLIERLGVFRLNGCDPGVYMMMGRSRRKTASHLLKYGWIEATSENLKNYFDGFALASRNGLFYERFKECGYTTPYTVKDYERFLNGFDHQINHEPIECLGEQDYSLENPKFKF